MINSTDMPNIKTIICKSCFAPPLFPGHIPVTENVSLKQFSVICEEYIQNKLIVICRKVSNVTRVIY